MTTTAQIKSSQLTRYNQRYLTLKAQIDREKRLFRYPAGLITELNVVRNSIVEMQNAHRRGGEVQ
jgi:hypothetical protein